MKVAIISSGNPSNMKGIMNFVQEKCTLMKEQDDKNLIIDVYLIRSTMSWFFKQLLLLLGRKEVIPEKQIIEDSLVIGNIEYKFLWYNYGLFDNFISTKLKGQFLSSNFKNKYGKYFSEYDILSTHTLIAHELALFCNKKYRKPYITTWHGSDINIVPKESPRFLPKMKEIIENASMNFFVSKALLIESDKITQKASKNVLYTGASKAFILYEEEKRKQLRKKYGVENKKVVVFAGNLVPIKNVMQLPELYGRISKVIGRENIKFWIIGNGPLENELCRALDQQDIDYTFWGKINPEKIPDFFNCSDLLTMISLNEGLPLVNLEAIKCGCSVVGSNVGGISEVIGKENTFDLGVNFIEEISDRAIEILVRGIQANQLLDEFSWEKAIDKELTAYKSILDIK